MEIRIRNAHVADAAALAALQTESWRGTYRGVYPDAFLDGAGPDSLGGRIAAAWDAFVPRQEHRAVMAEDAAGAAGFLDVLTGPQHWRMPFIDHFHVRPGLRGRGLGASLLRSAAAQARELDEPGLWLWVMAANDGARRFYKRMGGAEEERAVQRVHGKDIPALRMVWRDLAALSRHARMCEAV